MPRLSPGKQERITDVSISLQSFGVVSMWSLNLKKVTRLLVTGSLSTFHLNRPTEIWMCVIYLPWIHSNNTVPSYGSYRWPFWNTFLHQVAVFCVCFWTLPVVKLCDVGCRCMNVKHTRNDTEGGKTEVLGETLSNAHIPTIYITAQSDTTFC